MSRRVPWLDVDRARLSRRTFLRGAGAAIALPFLDAMWPRSARAQAAASARRFLAWYVPNGIHMADWTPATTGANYTIPTILAPLAPVRDEVLVLTGLSNAAARVNTMGGAHARGTGTFLTAQPVNPSLGTELEAGISIDQRIAQAIGAQTSLPSLQLGTEGGSSAGSCDSTSCAYSRNISWAGPQTPLAKETNPLSAFQRVFGGALSQLPPAEIERRRLLRLSILDTVTGEASRLRFELGGADRQKLDEYLTGVRALEVRVQDMSTQQCAAATEPDEPDDFVDRVRAMSDLMVLAFQCDRTRLITFMELNAGSNQTYPWLNIFDGHHQISHHQGNQANIAQLRTIDTWEVAQFSYLLQRLAAVQEPGGSLLDSSLVYFSSEIEDGDIHRHTNLPILLAGRGGGAVQSGRHLRFTGSPPIANLFLTVLRAFGIQDASFGQHGTAPLTL